MVKNKPLILSPVSETEWLEASKAVLGMWKNRRDMRDSVAWVRDIRESRNNSFRLNKTDRNKTND